MPIVAGVDSSTQSCTIELRDADSGNLLARGRRPHPPTYPPASEQWPGDWWIAFKGALDDALRVAQRRVQVRTARPCVETATLTLISV